MSFDDFLNRPKYEIEAIMRIIDDVDKKKNRINESVMKDLENSVPKTPPPA